MKGGVPSTKIPRRKEEPKANGRECAVLENSATSAVESELQIAGIVALQSSLVDMPEIALLNADDFIDQRCWRMLVTARVMRAERIPDGDIALYSHHLQRQTEGAPLRLHEVSEISRNVQSVAHIRYHADINLETSERRRHLQFAGELARTIERGASPNEIELMIQQHKSAEKRNSGVTARSFREMAQQKANQQLRPPVIDGIVREGETINIVSDSKVGKTWFVHGLTRAS